MEELSERLAGHSGEQSKPVTATETFGQSAVIIQETPSCESLAAECKSILKHQDFAILPAGYMMRSLQSLWIVGRCLEVAQDLQRWAFIGVFSSRENAVAACLDATYFVGSCNLDEVAPQMEIPTWLRLVDYPFGSLGGNDDGRHEGL